MIALFTQKTLYYEETFHYLYILDARWVSGSDYEEMNEVIAREIS